MATLTAALAFLGAVVVVAAVILGVGWLLDQLSDDDNKGE